jgi:uncharacterized protein (TIGR03083 family)
MVEVPELRLSHEERIDVIAAHGAFFSALKGEDLVRQVPACPGWTVEDVVRHVAAFAAAARAWCETGDLDGDSAMDLNLTTMAGVHDQPLDQLVGQFSLYESCLRERDAQTSALGHLGPETVGWHSWHCACEWGIHRHDVEVALGVPSSMEGDRAADSLRWTTDYVFGLIQTFRNADPFPAVRLIAAADDVDYVSGEGDPAASLAGTAYDLTLHLWRRPHGPITIVGDPVVARAYSGLAVGR